MTLGRKIRTYTLTFILLLSTLSILVITPDNVKGQTEGSTTLFFHDQEIQDEELLDLLYLYMDEKLFADLYEQDLENMTDEELEQLLSDWDELLELLFSAGAIIRTMDQILPEKENTSEHPPTLKSIFERIRQGEYEVIEDLLFSFAPFQSAMMYNGEEDILIDGDVTFNVYFSAPLWYFWNEDNVNVSFIILEDVDGYFEEKYVKSETFIVKRNFLNPLNNPTKYKIPVEVETILSPGDVILAEIDIDAVEKLFLSYMDFNVSDLNETLREIGESLSEISFLADIGESLLNVSDILGEETLDMNITDLLQQLSSSFFYDSLDYQSSITLPCELAGIDDNTRVYYLHSENLMDEESPTDETVSETTLSTSSGKWDGPELERSKILKEATASLYIDHQDLRRIINLLRGDIKITANLIYGEEVLTSRTQELSRNGILSVLQKPNEPIIFDFSNLDSHEIRYGSSLTLEVSANSTKFGILKFGRNANLLYDSTAYPSSLMLIFDETDHIQMDVVADPSNEIIVLGDIISYDFNIISDFKEDIDIITYGFSKNEKNKYTINIKPEKISVSKGGAAKVEILVTSIDDDIDAYYADPEEKLTVTFAAEGLTGKDTFDANIIISVDAVEYDINVIHPLETNIRHGENETFKIKIINNNSGYFPDSYTVDITSENDWNLSYDDYIDNLEAGNEAEVEVKVFVPQYTDISSDLLTITVTSEESIDHNKDTSVIIELTAVIEGPNVLELLYHFFETSAEGMGLDDMLGDFAPSFLGAIVFLIIFFIIIIFVYFSTIKYVNLICLERIKEINPNEAAKFEITIQNPYKRMLTYNLTAKNNPSSHRWDILLDVEGSIVLEQKQSKTVTLIVSPSDLVKADDFGEVTVVATVLEKQKTAKVLTVTQIKDAKSEISIIRVFNWPKEFKKGDIVETSFRIENKGNVSADNISVILNVNGKEKNKVEEVTIPSGGYADIKMPWIAVKGKNEINIVVR